MKKTILLTLTLAWMLPLTAIAQFETVWMKKLENGISSVTFSHNSKWIMAWLAPNIKIFDVETGELINDKIPATLQNPFFSLDDTHIYGIENNRIAYYNLETGLNESTAKSFDKSNVQFTVSKDQKYFLGTTRDTSGVGFGVWDMQTGDLLRFKKLYKEFDRVEIDSTRFTAFCQQIDIDCDNSRIFVREYTNYSKLLYYDNKGKPYFENNANSQFKIYSFELLDSIGIKADIKSSIWFSEDCHLGAVDKSDNTGRIFKIYDFLSDQLLSTMKIGEPSLILKGVKFTSDGNYFITASSVNSDLLSIWDVQTGKLLNQEYGTSWETLDVSNSMKFIVGSVGRTLLLKKLQTTDVPVEPDEIEVLYPNPTNGRVTLNFTLQQSSPVSISAMDINGGNPLVLFNSNLEKGNNSVTIDMAQIASGTYLVTLSAVNFHKTYKLIITR